MIESVPSVTISHLQDLNHQLVMSGLIFLSIFDATKRKWIFKNHINESTTSALK